MTSLKWTPFLLAAGLLFACHQGAPETSAQATPDTSATASVTIDRTTFTQGGNTFDAYVAYNPADTGKRPAVLVLPEWWGMNDYPEMRARMLAQLGYVAMAIDVYGNGKVLTLPDSASAYAQTLYANAGLAKERIDAAIQKIKTYPQVDTARIGAIGYCFGAGLLLNTVRLGDDLKGIVSFHGNLLGTPARKDLLHTRILVCQGNADQFVTPKIVAEFKKQMDSIGAPYAFIGYDGATHAFTNPAATRIGQQFHMPVAYNGKADTASWEAMKSFFANLFKQ